MDGVAMDASGLAGGGKIKGMGRLVNGSFGDACGSEWEDIDDLPEPWDGG